MGPVTLPTRREAGACTGKSRCQATGGGAERWRGGKVGDQGTGLKKEPLPPSPPSFQSAIGLTVNAGHLGFSRRCNLKPGLVRDWDGLRGRLALGCNWQPFSGRRSFVRERQSRSIPRPGRGLWRRRSRSPRQGAGMPPMPHRVSSGGRLQGGRLGWVGPEATRVGVAGWWVGVPRVATPASSQPWALGGNGVAVCTRDQGPVVSGPEA